MNVLSIVTATYNRINTLPRLYESLYDQTNQKFKWIIIDDGSTDQTEEKVKEWIKEKKIEIIYEKQENRGKPYAINKAVAKVKTELVMIVDSDDFLLKNSVETVLRDWEKYRKNKKICGLSYLKETKENRLIGKRDERKEVISNHIKYRINNEDKADKAEIFRSEILKQYPFPIIEGEKFISECIVWNRIAKQYDTVYINETIYICEYQEEGLSSNWRKINIQNPIGATLVAKEMTLVSFKMKIRIKNMILYSMYGLISQKKVLNLYKEIENKRMFSLLLGIGYLAYFYYRNKYRMERLHA